MTLRAPLPRLLFCISSALATLPVIAQTVVQTSSQTGAQTSSQTGAQTNSQTGAAPAPAAASAGGTNVTTLSVDARLVNIPVVVRDKKGALITNLTKDDFTLQVDAHPQVIRYFDRDNNLPLNLGLLVDTSMSQRDVLDDERTASTSFLDSMLNPAGSPDRDKAFVIQFAHSTELLQDLTSSRPKLQAALKDIEADSGRNTSSNDPSDPNSSTDNNNGGRNGSSRSRRGAGTVLYDALFLSSDELMAKQKGRKALIILSDGVDNGSKENLTRSIEATQRADTIVYAIYFKGEEHGGGNNNSNRGGGFPGGRGGGIGFPGGGGYPGGGGGYPGGGRGGNRQPNSGGSETRVDGKKILERICTETGGRLFEVSKKQTVENIYGQIAEELRSQYRLGYTPDAATSADGYHQLDLALAHNKNLYVQTRDGYYTGK